MLLKQRTRTSGGKKESAVKVKVKDECTASNRPGTNFCSFRGKLDEPGADGAEIEWEVVVFSGNNDVAQWRVQFQAFSETTSTECQCDIRVKGAYGDTKFVSNNSIDTGILFADSPELTLQVKSVTIVPSQAICG